MRLDDLESRTVAATSIDYEKIKGLIKTCETEHTTHCAVEPRPHVSGLEVIDTRTLKVIKAPDQCEYLALSYVWGIETGNAFANNIRNSPPVIKDAISVTNNLGYNYLWVDRYVSRPGHKRTQIRS